jgi:hypothetical protein
MYFAMFEIIEQKRASKNCQPLPIHSSGINREPLESAPASTFFWREGSYASLHGNAY